MADKQSGFIRKVVLLFDKAAARRVQDETEEALAKAGKQGGEELSKAMEQGGAKAARALASSLNLEYRKRIAAARRQLADETIDEAQFREAGRKAAKEFNTSYSAGLKELAAKNKLTDLELTNASGRFKSVGSAAALAVGGGSLLGPLAGVLTAGAVLRQATDAIAKADELSASVRKLGGAARVTGTDLSFLQRASSDVQEQFKLSIPFANNLVAAMNKMTVKAGDANLLLPALSAWLDLAAANGLSAAEAMDALQTTIIGQDEGLNKLGLANPQQIYDAWGKAAGVSAAKMTDAQKAQAILNAVTEAGSKVQGEYGKYLESNAGQAEQEKQKLDALKASTGAAIQPFRRLALQLQEFLFTGLGPVVGKFADLIGYFQDLDQRNEAWWRRVLGISVMEADGSAAHPYQLPGVKAVGPNQLNPRLTIPGITITAPDRKAATSAAEASAKEAATRVSAMWENFDKFLHSQAGYDLATGAGMSKGALNVPDIIRSAQAGVYKAAAGPTRGQTAFSALFGSTKEEFEADASEAAYNIASSFQDAFDLMRSEGATLGHFMEGMFRGMAGFALAGLASFAQGKAKENFAAAIEAAAYALGFTSTGNFASASAAWASAAQHTAAGVAWGALAGASGSARGAVTGGGGAIPQNVRSDPGLSTFDASRGRGQPVNVYVNPFDPANPVQATQLGKAVDLHVHLSRPAWAVAR